MAIKCPQCHSENPDTKQFCGDCGTLLPASKSSQPEVTKTLQTPNQELTTGTTFADRYQVIEELGRGGMGRVYKVFDTKIQEKVALKLIKPEIALDRETIERFANELRLARKIRHKNVSGVYDLGEADGAFFLTMELVPGEDLKRLIRRVGQLPVAKAVSIAQQISEGLAEAHRFGIIHRDLKPQNIMLDEEGNARIMDFGIARSLSGKGITSAGVMIGTPEYMSPEQAEAKEIDRRSDIYSLGVILYELVTGRVPFKGDSPLSIAMKHKGELPESPKALNPQISDSLNRVILRCLEKNREERYGSAEELQADLEKVGHGLPPAEGIAPKRKTSAAKEITVTFSAKKLVIPALAFLALIAAGIGLWKILPSRKPAPPPSASSQPTLAVLDFENKSGDKSLDFWRDALAELLIADLSQSKYIRVVSGDEMLTILRRLGLAEAEEYSSEDIGKIAAQTGATHVLRGSFIKAGQSIVITVGLQRPGSGENARGLRLEARGENEIIPKVDELTRQVKEGFELSAAQLTGDIEKPAGEVTTSSPEALKYYLEGRRFLNKLENELAISCLEKAVGEDPEFAMAYKGIAAAYYNMGNRAASRKYHAKALELSRRLPDSERLNIEASQLAAEENYAGAIEVYRRLLQAYPGHRARNGLALAYLSVEDNDQAIACLESDIPSRKWAAPVVNLADAYMAKGSYQKAQDICRAFLRDVQEVPLVRVHLLTSYLCARQFDLALAEAENDARRTAEELKALIDKGINRKELRRYEYILGLIELGKKNPGQAAKLFDRACRRLDFENLGGENNQAMYFDGLARALFEAGDLDKAGKGYEKTTLLTIAWAGRGDIYARAYYMLGKIAERQKDMARAKGNTEKFLDLWKDADAGLPEVEDARKRLPGLS